MGPTYLPRNPIGDDEDTDAWRTRHNNARIEDRISATRSELAANVTPPRAYTAITLIVAGMAVLDWIAVAVHTTLSLDQPLSPALGTHQVFVAALSMSATVLGAVWAWWRSQNALQVKRDGIIADQHELQMQEIRRLLRAFRRDGDVDAAALLARTQQFIDESAPNAVVRSFSAQSGRRSARS
jgi:hypothetical protein